MKKLPIHKTIKASILSTTDKLSTLANDSEHQDMIKIDGIKVDTLSIPSKVSWTNARERMYKEKNYNAKFHQT